MLREVRDWAEELACRAGLDGLGSAGRRVAIVVLVAAVCAAGVAWFSDIPATAAQPQAPAATAAPSSPAGSPARVASGAAPAASSTVTVHVVGQVRRPGVYELAGGARASDAVAAAGGLLGAADQGAVNLARVVADGEQIAVPREGEGPAATTGGVPGAPAAGGKVDLNTASEAQLDTLPGIGPATAQKIVADRTANGPFRTVDDLMRVPGIGPAKVESLKDLVSAG